MPEDSRERPATERSDMEHAAAPLRFAAAGGPGSTGLDGTTSSDLRPGTAVDDPLLGGIIDATALLAGLLLAFCGTVLAARRLAGAMVAAPSPVAILAASGAALMLLVIAGRGSGRGAARWSGPLAKFGLLATVGAVALPLRIVSPAAAAAAVAALAAAFVAIGGGGLGSALRRFGRQAGGGRVSTATPRLHPGDDARTVTAATAPAPPVNGRLLQRFERFSLPDGTECVRGRVRVSVATGSRLGVAHVGFCPPLAAVPAVDATTDYDGVEAVVSAAEVLPWGVRIECRLDEPAEELIEIPVDLVATAHA